MGFPRIENGSGLPFLPPRDISDSGNKPTSTLQCGFLIAVVSLVVEHGFKGMWASVVEGQRLQSAGSVIVAV